MKRNTQFEIALSCGAMILLLLGVFLFNSTSEPKTYQEILNQATGHRPIMSNENNNFYSFLRIYIFSISLYFIYINYQNKKTKIIYGLILIGIIFNPILPLYLSINSWTALDFIMGLFFSYYLFLTYKSRHKEN